MKTTKDIVKRGQAIYEERLRAALEPTHKGEYLIINVDTGEYELDADDVAASLRASRRFGMASLFTMRVGHRAAYRLGTRLGIRPAC